MSPIKRWVLIFLLMLATSCNKSSPWSFQKVSSDFPIFNSYQLTYTPENLTHGLAIQVLKGSFGTLAYLFVYNCSFETPKFSFRIGDTTTSYQGIIMQGNQRMLMPQNATESLLAALSVKQSVTIQCGSYCTVLYPNNLKNWVWDGVKAPAIDRS